MEVLEYSEAQRITNLLGLLTGRERQLIKYFATGYSNAEIGVIVGIATATVKIHKSNVYTKLGVNNLKDLMRLLEVKPTHPLE